MSFAYAVKVIKLIPMAVRLSAAGGATYGSVKVGAWSSRTQDSKEKLDQLQREIQYPVAGKVCRFRYVSCINVNDHNYLNNDLSVQYQRFDLHVHVYSFVPWGKII